MSSLSPDTPQEILSARREKRRPKTDAERASVQAADRARQEEDAKYLEWVERHDQATEEMMKAELQPYDGGVDQPVFWKDGQAVESGAARLDCYESRHELRALLNTMRAFEGAGAYQVPKYLLLEAAQFFYLDGQLSEVRASGYDLTPGRDFATWQTPTAPEVQADAVTLRPDAARRAQVAVLNETASEALAVARDFRARLSEGEAPAPKNISRLLIIWHFRTTPPEDEPPQGEHEEEQRADGYNIHTGQEVRMLAQSACNGKSGEHWLNNDNRRARVYEERNGSHRVEVELTPEDEEEGRTMATLEALTKAQDADFAFALFYVCRVLAPPAPLARNQAAIGWIDLDDVTEKIGWNPTKRSTAERDEMRARVWNYIVYGDRAKIVGKRTTQYTDRATGEVIETRLESAVWRIMAKERPEQPALFGEVPRRVQLVIGKEWEPLLTSPHLAQYLPLGEILGSIAPNQISGDWARSIGLSLAGLWRRKPREVAAESIRPTRRELLTSYTPKTTGVEELLNSNDPRRAVKYYWQALDKLTELEFLAREGEAARTLTEMREALSGYGWGRAWLDEAVTLKPGPKMQEAHRERVEALPPLKPRDLTAKRRGRPRKLPKPE